MKRNHHDRGKYAVYKFYKFPQVTRDFPVYVYLLVRVFHFTILNG